MMQEPRTMRPLTAIAAEIRRFDSRIRQAMRFRFRADQLVNRLRLETARPAAVLKYRPIWLLLYLTDACNLRCRMCPHHTPHAVDNFAYRKELTFGMSDAVLDAVLRRFPEAMVASLAGVGEPTLHKKFPAIVERLAAASKMIDLTTNGYYLTGDCLGALTQISHVREVSVSLNGASPDEHFAMTGRRGFADVLGNVAALVEERSRTGFPYRIAVSQVCTSENLDKWNDYVALADRLGVDRVYLHNNIDMNVAATDLRTVTTSRQIAAAVGALPSRINKTEIVPPVLIDRFVGPPKCQWFFRNLAFDAAGSLGSCGRVMNPQPAYGSIFSGEDLWNNDYMRRLRNTFLDPGGAMLEPVCLDCVENHT